MNDTIQQLHDTQRELEATTATTTTDETIGHGMEYAILLDGELLNTLAELLDVELRRVGTSLSTAKQLLRSKSGYQHGLDREEAAAILEAYEDYEERLEEISAEVMLAMQESNLDG